MDFFDDVKVSNETSCHALRVSAQFNLLLYINDLRYLKVNKAQQMVREKWEGGKHGARTEICNWERF